MGRLDPGAKGRFTTVVEDWHLASSMGNVGVNVLSTPAVAYLFEGAATDALKPVMMDGELSVGTEILVRHLRPTPPGMRVKTTVTFREMRGARYFFDAVVYDEVEKVAEGTIERAIIDGRRCERTVAEKLKPVAV